MIKYQLQKLHIEGEMNNTEITSNQSIRCVLIFDCILHSKSSIICGEHLFILSVARAPLKTFNRHHKQLAFVLNVSLLYTDAQT